VENGQRTEQVTDDPTELLHRITGEALERGQRLDDLSVTRPSLEDVYLELTADAASAAVTEPETETEPVP
jgi:ABC-2 type transport system ATP-binding protein